MSKYINDQRLPKASKITYIKRKKTDQVSRVVLLQYVDEMILKHLYGRAFLALETLSHILPPRHHFRLAMLGLACIHGSRELYSNGASEEYFIPDKTVQLQYMQLLNNFTAPDYWCEILREYLSFEMQLISKCNYSLPQLEEVYNRFNSYSKAKQFSKSSSLHGEYGMIAFSIYCKYIEEEGLLPPFTNAVWVPLTTHVIVFYEKSAECLPPPIAFRFLKESLKFLRTCVKIDPQQDYYVEYLIRALVSTAGTPENSNKSTFRDHFIDEGYWEEIRSILDGLPRGVGISPAVARLRYQVYWDLEPFTEEKNWPSAGFELLQLDPLADWDLVFLPIVSYYSELSEASEPVQNDVIWRLLVIILNRIELKPFISFPLLWFYLAQTLVKFRNIQNATQEEGDCFKKLFEIRKHWYPLHMFSEEPSFTSNMSSIGSNFDISLLENLEISDIPQHLVFLKAICANLIYQPSHEHYHYPGETIVIHLNTLGLFKQMPDVFHLSSLYPGLSHYFP